MNAAATGDAPDRARALIPDRSFIVQAPAGSGKTGLLIQRYLALLATVGKPEEIVAITFTRKAAAEMRLRLIEALNDAAGEPPAEAYRRTTYDLARAVVARDEARDWGIALNPARLKVMTIDALCASLVRQMPMLSQFGAVPRIANHPQRLYRRATRRLLAALESNEQSTGSLQTVLVQLDNDLRRTERLLMDMLASRDRWLGHVAGNERAELERAALETALKGSVARALEAAVAALPAELIEPLIQLAAYASSNSPAESPLAACNRIDALPDTQIERLAMWRGLRHLLYTKNGKPRSRVSAALGFPAPSASNDEDEQERRRQFNERAADLQRAVAEQPAMAAAFVALDDLPTTQYRQEDWQMLQALKRLLPRAAAELNVVFQEAGEVDYTEVAHRALAALGSDEQPTDLALQLDYRLRHMLVDEFQDTSRTQFDLLCRLVAGWEDGDGRTLFLVGDPMQSIYRFRDADVGLFLHARRHGVAGVALESLRLTANFRSRPALVDFCNSVFAQIFPASESIEESAVSFVSSSAAREERAGSGAQVHAFENEEPAMEGERVAQLVMASRRDNAEASVAILVRTRSQVAALLPALQRHTLRFRAVEIEALGDQTVVGDLYALTRALLHLADRTAWLAVLRAPWCGLTLEDLYALGGANPKLTIWELVINAAKRDQLGRDGMLRLSRVKSVLAKSLAEKGRRDLRRWVEGTWTALGGPACVSSQSEMDNAQAYLALLEQLDDEGSVDDLEELNVAVGALFAPPDPLADDRLQVMTMHRAKGLEFDVVILPGLDRRAANDKRSMLSWLEQTDAQGRAQILLAPIQGPGEEDPIGRYVARVDRRRDQFEQLRLLYVAATRAREQLHLLSRVERDSDGALRMPAGNTLAARVWPALAAEFEAAVSVTPATATALVRRTQRELRRVPSEWMLPQAPQPKPWRSTDSVHQDGAAHAGVWGGDVARHIGTAVHRVLQQVALEGVDRWIGRWMDGLDHYLSRMLGTLGVPPKQLEHAVTRAHSAIRNCLLDERGRWLLTGHRDARAELPLSGWLDGRLYNVVLDRTFIDQNNVRWIIDYKTGLHEGGTVEAFIDRELELYRGQLELYGRVMQRLEQTPIRLGLYFPLVQGWREWAFAQPVAT